MDLIIEFLLELIFEFSEESLTSAKMPKFIRYSAITFFILLFLLVCGVLVICIITSAKENVLLSICFGALLIFFIVGLIYKIKNVYLKKVNK